MRTIFSFFILALSACAHQPLAGDGISSCPEGYINEEGDLVTSICLRMTADDYKQYYLEDLSYLHLFPLRNTLVKDLPYDEFEFVSVVISPSFDSHVGIILYKNIDKRDVEPVYNEREYYSLFVHFWQPYRNEDTEQTSSPPYKTIIRKYPTGNITGDEFGHVYDSLIEAGFGKERQPPYFENACADGTSYYIEASVMDGTNFIARHSCDFGFPEKFSYTHELFGLARKKFPEISTLLDDITASIRVD